MMKKNNGYINKMYIKVYSFLQKKSLCKIKELMYYIDGFLIIFIKKNIELNSKKSIAIVYNLALGDGIVFRNSIMNLNSIYSKNEYNITLFCQKGLKKIYEDIDIIDNIIELDFNKATINLKERYKNLKIVFDKNYDILLDPVGANECYTNVLMSRCIRANKKIGCILTSKKVTCSKRILQKTYNEINKINEKSLIGQYFEFFYNDYEVKYNKIKGKKPCINLPKEYYIVFPSASTNLKKWPIDRYAEIVKKIYNKTGLPLLICGTSVDKEEIGKLISKIGGVPYIDIIGKTSLIEFIYVINNAKFIITNDTSTYHIAVTNQVPVAIITGGYTYDRYVKYEFQGFNKYKQPYVIVHKMKCFNCNNKCINIKSNDSIWPCLGLISVKYAWGIINKMIDKELK